MINPCEVRDRLYRNAHGIPWPREVAAEPIQPSPRTGFVSSRCPFHHDCPAILLTREAASAANTARPSTRLRRLGEWLWAHRDWLVIAGLVVAFLWALS